MKSRDLQHLYVKSSHTFYQSAFYTSLFFALMALSIISWDTGYWYASIGCWLVQAHIGHINVLAFHEASHYTLHPRRSVNELFGIAIGSLTFTPLSAYRYAHNQHHTHLASARDPELWPYSDTSIPRWQRMFAAFAELCCGLFYTPFTFLRAVLIAERLPQSTRLRLTVEYVLIAMLWGVILATVAFLHAWEAFLVGVLIPFWIAGNLHSLRKFVEHMGLLGDDVASGTRTVVDSTRLGKIVSHSMLHIDFHGPHHSYAKIPFFRLPEATALLYSASEPNRETENFYPSYAAALWDMLKTIPNPRVGMQWAKSDAASGERESRFETAAS